MVSTRQNHDDFCDHICDIVDDLLDGATLNELLKIGRLIRLFEIHNIIPQLTIPFRLQSHHYAALPFLFKMNDQNTLDLARLPMPRQIIVLLDVLAHQRTNVTNLVVNQGGDRVFLQECIDLHQREVREGTPLDFATAVQVSPLADRRAPPQDAEAAREAARNVRRRLYGNDEEENEYDPNADANDEREPEVVAGFDLTNPTANPQPGNRNVGTIKTYELMGIPSSSNVIHTLAPTRESNPKRCLGTILSLLKVPYVQREIDDIVNIGDILVNNVAHDARLDYLRDKGLTVTANTEPLEMLFLCQQPYDQMVLMVCHVIPHTMHEAHLEGIPPGAHYVAYMLLFAGKHMVLPFSHTNCNMHIGTMLCRLCYGEHGSGVAKTFTDFASANMHQKLCPIQGQRPVGNSILRQLNFVHIYNIENQAV